MTARSTKPGAVGRTADGRQFTIFSDAEVAELRSLPARVSKIEEWQTARDIDRAVVHERDGVMMQRLDRIERSIQDIGARYDKDKGALIKWLVGAIATPLVIAFVTFVVRGGLSP